MIKFKKEIAGEFAIPQKSKESFRHIAFSATRIYSHPPPKMMGYII